MVIFLLYITLFLGTWLPEYLESLFTAIGILKLIIGWSVLQSVLWLARQIGGFLSHHFFRLKLIVSPIIQQTWNDFVAFNLRLYHSLSHAFYLQNSPIFSESPAEQNLHIKKNFSQQPVLSPPLNFSYIRGLFSTVEYFNQLNNSVLVKVKPLFATTLPELHKSTENSKIIAEAAPNPAFQIPQNPFGSDFAKALSFSKDVSCIMNTNMLITSAMHSTGGSYLR